MDAFGRENGETARVGERPERLTMGTETSTRGSRPCGPEERGVALILVLWVLTLLSVMALEFCFAMRTEVNITRNYKEETQLYFMAQGGIQRAIAELVYKNDDAIQAKLRPAQNSKLIKAEDALPPPETWRADGRPYSVAYGAGEAEVRVTSEAGRVNLNRASESLLRRVVQSFLEMGEQRDVVVDSILDWRDPDDFHRVNGAENDYYHSLSEPYDCKNADFDSVEELLLVRGVTPELFYGRKKDAAEEDGEKVPAIGFKDVFTVFSTTSQVDVNAAPAEVLKVVLGIPYSVAKRIVEAREEKEFENLADLLQKVPEVAAFLSKSAATGFILFKSTTAYYTIYSKGKTKGGETSRGLSCVVKIDKKEDSGYKVVLWRDLYY
jgi:general secretion pathway protein K